MLVLSRRVNESIVIGDEVDACLLGAPIKVCVLHVRRGRVRLGISAPPGLAILRAELVRHRPSPTCETEGDTNGHSQE